MTSKEEHLRSALHDCVALIQTLEFMRMNDTGPIPNRDTAAVIKRAEAMLEGHPVPKESPELTLLKRAKSVLDSGDNLTFGGSFHDDVTALVGNEAGGRVSWWQALFGRAKV